MGHPEKSTKAAQIAILGSILLAVVLFFTPEVLSRIVGLAGEGAFFFAFRNIQEAEFTQWQTANPTAKPSNGWRAIGWGLIGVVLWIILFLLISFLLAIAGLKPR
jgi:hypothetical protein